MSNKTFYISMGSNLGSKIKNLENALTKILELGTLNNVSSLYETEPYGFKEQDDFYNCVISLDSKLDISAFMNKLLNIEKVLGRKRDVKNGPRLIDLDIIAVDSIKYNKDGIIVPHPRFHERRFVLEPLNEIAPNFILLDKPIHEYLKDCKDELSINKIKERIHVDPI